jgi:hypothetical protein
VCARRTGDQRICHVNRLAPFLPIRLIATGSLCCFPIGLQESQATQQVRGSAFFLRPDAALDLGDGYATRGQVVALAQETQQKIRHLCVTA